MELECPDCGMILCVDDIEKDEIVACPGCDGELEFTGYSLIRDES